MFATEDEEYIVRHASQASLMLFLGAGFSCEATNQLGRPLPNGKELAKAIWELLKFPGEHTDDTLADLYEALLHSGTTHSRIRNFLEQHLTCRQVPGMYGALVGFYWYRVYTTNVDDLLARTYSAAGGRVEILAYPKDEVSERDQSLNTVQLIHLNGRLPCSPTDVTFSPRQYARASLNPQPLYEQFVRDFATHPTIFIGTQLNEPLFWQALEARQERGVDISEYRPKSYLVAPSISPAKRIHLAQLNVIPVEGTTSEFLSWLTRIRVQLPDRRTVLQRSAPDLAAVMEAMPPDTVREKDLRAFSAAFGGVPSETRSGGYRSLFLLGAAPRWEDLFLNLDAPRGLSPQVKAFVESSLESESVGVRIGVILGSAGSGKSTILRRVGLQLRQSGRSVYVTSSESLPTPDVIRRVLDGLPEKTILLFDNAEVALPVLPDLIKEVERCERPPVILIASRTNDFDRLWSRFSEAAAIVEFHVPNLSRSEIEALLRILEDQGVLGELRGLSRNERISVFEGKAQKQILVAMREATTSKAFDLIIKDEFEKLVPAETQLLYVCVALATEAGYRLTREEFVACAKVPSAEALHLLNRNLRDIVVPTGSSNGLLLLRHRLLAELAVTHITPRPMLREAYIRLLAALAPELRGSNWRSRVAGLAHALWSHKTIYARFRKDLEEARSIFETLSQWYGQEPHFWLQFGNLELEGRDGDLRLAENYLRQAESLDKENPFIQNALGHLFMRKAIEAGSIDESRVELERGSQLLIQRIDSTELADAYAIHIYCSQRYGWTRIWLVGDEENRRRELEDLRRLLQRAIGKHPRHQRLRKMSEVVERAYLELAIPRSSRPELPPLPDDSFSA
jgi:hypothetical protein